MTTAPTILMTSANEHTGSTRMVRWTGHPAADFGDQVDPNDPYGRTRRELLYTRAYSPQMADFVRKEIRRRQRFRALPGVVTRQLGPDHVPGMRKTYRWGGRYKGGTGGKYGPGSLIAEMDAADATALMLSKWSVEFRYADDEHEETRQHQLGPAGNQGREDGSPTGLVLARLFPPGTGPTPGARTLRPEEVAQMMRRR